MIKTRPTFKDNQMAMDYVIYMIAGSYFKSTECVSPLVEGGLYIMYKEAGEKKQLCMENEVDLFMKDEVLPKLPKGFLNQDVKVKLIAENGKPTKVVFVGEDCKLQICGIAAKSGCNITSQIFLKKSHFQEREFPSSDDLMKVS